MPHETEAALRWPECILTQDSDLGGLIHVVPDDAEVVDSPQGPCIGWDGELRRYPPGTVYRASEALLLAAAELSADELRAVHQVKQALGVHVDEIVSRPRRRWTEAEVTEAWAGWSLEKRRRYTDLRIRALRLLGATEERATLEQRTTAASWAAERLGPGEKT